MRQVCLFFLFRKYSLLYRHENSKCAKIYLELFLGRDLMKKSFCIWILCSLLIMLFAATSFAAGREKRVILGVERIDEPFAK